MRRPYLFCGLLASAGAVVFACDENTQVALHHDASAPADEALPDSRVAIEAGVASTAQQDATVAVAARADRPGFCERPGADAVRDLFCGAEAPRLDSLRALEAALALQQGGTAVAYQEPYDAGPTLDPGSIVDNVVVLAHSTALSGRLVSPINPRVILLGSDSILTFQRGVQQVELASRARDKATFNFYLLSFGQACNTHAAGCSTGDLYTPAVERDWRTVTVRDDEELKNTAQDCRQCHQRGLETPMLLMRELQSPWTHFFELNAAGAIDYGLPGVRGQDLVEDYVRAKGDELYAGVEATTLRHTVGFVLQNVVNRAQPLLFDAPAIEEERWPYVDGGYASVPVRSPTWDRAYEAFKRGEQLALPYFEPRVTDPQKQAALTSAYQRFRAGELAAAALPDLSDIFPDDPRVRAQIGLQTEPDASPVDALIQACASCHNDVLDQTLTRARFNVDLRRMSRAELDLAVTRIERAPHDDGVMPPAEARQLDASTRERLVAYLRGDTHDPVDADRLARAAVLGMRGGTP